MIKKYLPIKSIETKQIKINKQIISIETKKITSAVRSKDKPVACNPCNSSRCKIPWLLDQ